ncbi:MAG: ribonuclease PH [Promethearchaeota archaeon]
MTQISVNREDGRSLDALRPIKITRNYLKWPEGSVLVEQGNTKVIVTASVEDNVPRFMRDSGKGWITAEYDMLPRATDRRRNRDRNRKIPGRSMEIQRLIGRSIRAAFNLEELGEITIKIDADVIQADGGTRCASITGAFVACYDAIQTAIAQHIIDELPNFHILSAISVGIVNEVPMLDLAYIEDSNAEVDMNVVMNEKGELIEVQGTGEGRSFTRSELDSLLELAEKGNQELIDYIKAELNM